MSRLDSLIGRLLAQRACLSRAIALVGDAPGPVVELGLGNGRTFDHLRALLPDRDIYVFERRPGAHPSCTPAPERLIVGDLRETFPTAMQRLPAPVALVHSDIGTGDPVADAPVSAWLAGALPSLLATDAIVVSDQRLEDGRLAALPLPDEVPSGRYFLYRYEATREGRP